MPLNPISPYTAAQHILSLTEMQMIYSYFPVLGFQYYRDQILQHLWFSSSFHLCQLLHSSPVSADQWIPQRPYKHTGFFLDDSTFCMAAAWVLPGRAEASQPPSPRQSIPDAEEAPGNIPEGLLLPSLPGGRCLPLRASVGGKPCLARAGQLWRGHPRGARCQVWIWPGCAMWEAPAFPRTAGGSDKPRGEEERVSCDNPAATRTVQPTSNKPQTQTCQGRTWAAFSNVCDWAFQAGRVQKSFLQLKLEVTREAQVREENKSQAVTAFSTVVSLQTRPLTGHDCSEIWIKLLEHITVESQAYRVELSLLLRRWC